MKYKVRMMGFDLDGTLLDSQKRLTGRTEEVLKKAVSRGIELLPITGRPLCGLPEEIRNFPGMHFAITSNGARIVDMRTGEVLRERLIEAEVGEQLLHIFDKYDALREIYYDGTGYVEAGELERVEEFLPGSPMVQYICSTRVAVENLWEKFREEYRALDKIQGLFANLEEREQALEEIQKLGDVEATNALVNNIEVNAGGVNKGEALLWLADRLGIPVEKTMGFGDGGNDLALMKYAGVGVAMKNGKEDVKQAADTVTEYTNDEDGIAVFIENYVL